MLSFLENAVNKKELGSRRCQRGFRESEIEEEN
jgi:hypothetical protein